MKPLQVLSVILIFIGIAYSQDKPKVKINLGDGVQEMSNYAITINDTAKR